MVQNKSKIIVKRQITRLILIIAITAQHAYGQDSSTSNLEFDHILIFANNDALKDSLDELFTPAEKLTTEHTSQGTVGYYYLFYNTYLELLFLKDSTKAIHNANKFGSDYVSRWDWSHGSCPIGFGMIMSPWDTSSVNKNFHKYQSSDSPDDEYYLMSHHNHDLTQPLVYVSMPHRAYESLKSIEEVNQRDKKIRNDLRKYLTHDTHAKNISQLTYSHSDNNINEGNLKILNRNSKIQLKRSGSTALTLVFDNKRERRKTFKLNQTTELIIYY